MTQTADSAIKSQDAPLPRPEVWRMARNGLLGVSNALFLGFMVLLAFCNRLCADDFSALSTAKIYGGLFGALGWWWRHWTGRMVSMSVMISVSQAVERDGKLLWYSLITLAVWIFAVYALLHRLTPKTMALKFRRGERANLAVFIAGLAVFASFDRGEVWFWLSGSSTYLWPLSLLLLGAALLLSAPLKIWRIALATLFFMLASGCNEISGLLPIVVCGGALLREGLRRARSASGPKNDAALNRWLWPFLGSLLATAMVALAPGNRLRLQTEVPLPIGRALLLCPQIVFQVTKFSLIHRLPWFVMAVAAGYFGGEAFQNVERAWGRTQTRRVLALGTLGLLAGLYLSLLPSTVALGETPPLRAVFQDVVLLLGYSAMLGFVFARQEFAARFVRAWRLALGLCLLASSVLTLRFARQQTPVVTAYARAFDARYAEALRRRDAGDTREMMTALLPRSPDRWINTNDITEDPRHWINTNFRNALRLPFDTRIGR